AVKLPLPGVVSENEAIADDEAGEPEADRKADLLDETGSYSPAEAASDSGGESGGDEPDALGLGQESVKIGRVHFALPMLELNTRNATDCFPEKIGGTDAPPSQSREETPMEGQALNAPVRWLRKGGCREGLRGE